MGPRAAGQGVGRAKTAAGISAPTMLTHLVAGRVVSARAKETLGSSSGTGRSTAALGPPRFASTRTAQSRLELLGRVLESRAIALKVVVLLERAVHKRMARHHAKQLGSRARHRSRP